MVDSRWRTGIIMTNVEAVDGKKHCPCNGGHYILVYRDGQVIQKGVHSGLTSIGSDGFIEYGDTEQDMIDRIAELGLEDLPDEND